MSTLTVELYNGPEDGHRIDLPTPEEGKGLPPRLLHFGIPYLDSGMTTEDGLPVYVHAGRTCGTIRPENREGQL